MATVGNKNEDEDEDDDDDDDEDGLVGVCSGE